MDCSEHIGRGLPLAHQLMMQSGGRMEFVYIGRASLTVIGSATGRQYRFDGPGRRLKIDLRDAPGILTIRVLRRIEPDLDEAESRY
jgi:hypothetical protein